MRAAKKALRESRYRIAKNWLIFWTLFIGAGAVAGALAMLLDPSGQWMGIDQMLPYFQKLPFAELLFQDFLFSGVALLIVNGITNLAAAALLICRRKAGIILGGLFGVTLMLWICIQFYMFPLNFMSTIYFVFGLIQAATAYAAWVFFKQESFAFDAADYENIGKNADRLVVYFSRMGYVKKVAYAAANASGAALYEIRAREHTSGTKGFWWCGRFGMHRWSMPIQPLQIDPAAYQHITICAPIWVFALASPVRAFCKQVSGRVQAADYILVHHTSGHYTNVAREMDAILGVSHTDCRDVQCRMGDLKLIEPSSQR